MLLFVHVFSTAWRCKNHSYSLRPQENRLRGWIWPSGHSLPIPTSRTPGKCNAFSLCWRKTSPFFLPHLFLCLMSPLCTASSPLAFPRRPPQLNQHSFGHQEASRVFPAPSPPQPSFSFTFALFIALHKFVSVANLQHALLVWTI